ncbi:uncharacterized protein LOC134253560 [Saccostrea cucullata]|uniref:uncharacterized protein LOC134253560 n=1 Tax=Saccostrea cuccullata TaxID=36930 RepID=UPI002ED5E373
MSVLWYVLVFVLVMWTAITTASDVEESPHSKHVDDDVVLKELVYEMRQTLKFQASRIDSLEKRLTASERRVNLLLDERQHREILFEKLTSRLTKLESECDPIKSRLILPKDNATAKISQREGENVKSRTERLLAAPTSTSLPSSMIAFHAYMSSTLKSPGGNQILKFDVVKKNAGNGYHPATGVFIAPESGQLISKEIKHLFYTMSVLWYVLVFVLVMWTAITTASSAGESLHSENVDDDVVLKELVYEMRQTLKLQASRIDSLEKRLTVSERRVNLLLDERQHREILFEKLTSRLTKLESECDPIKSRLILQQDNASAEISQRKRGNVKSRQERLLAVPTSTSLPSSMIAFHAYMSSTLKSPGGNQILKFDVVKTNAGNGYHPSTGVFIAPESGLYVFSWTLRVRNNADHASELVVNNDVYDILYMYAHTHDGHVTGIIVADVQSGDDVYVRIKAACSNHGDVWSDVCGHSSFKGWKIF